MSFELTDFSNHKGNAGNGFLAKNKAGVIKT